MSLPKLKLDEIKRVNLGFPALWETVAANGEIILLHFRYGNLTVYECDDKKSKDELKTKLLNADESSVNGARTLLKEPKDEFCLEGILSEEDLKIMLTNNGLIEEDEQE